MDKELSTFMVALVGSSGGAWVGIKLILDYLEKRRLSKQEHELKMKSDCVDEKTIDLKRHGLFKKLDMLEHEFTYNFVLPDIGRTLLVKEMVVHKIRIWREVLEEMVENFDDSVDLEAYCMKYTCMGFTRYANWYLSDYTAVSICGNNIRYSKEDVDTMNIFSERFKVWHKVREDLVTTGIHEQINSNMFESTNKEKLNDILFLYLMAFIQMSADAEKTIYALNGSLTGKKFLGNVIGDIPKNTKLL